jgi:hypothetical protein
MKQKKGNGECMALKLDMEKAFDSMEWEFLLKILDLLGFILLGFIGFANALLLLLSPFYWMELLMASFSFL